MATLTRTQLPSLGATFSGGTSGQAAGFVAASGGGDLIPISSGRGTVFRVKSTGTAVTVTIDSVVPSQYGTDQNIVLTLAATDEQEVFIPNDGVGRFDQGGANAGLMSVTYSQVVGVSVAAKQVP